MGAFDFFLIAVILGGTLWLLYHSLWKKKGAAAVLIVADAAVINSNREAVVCAR